VKPALRAAATRSRIRRGFSLSFAALAPGAHASIPGVSVTRASSATVQTGTATLAHAAVDEARVGRLADGEAPGLLIESAKANHNSAPLDFSNAAWTLFGTPTRTGSQSDPAGGTSAHRIQASSGVHGIGETTQTAIAGATRVTTSVWCKATAGTESPNTNLFKWTGVVSRKGTAEAVGTTWERVAITETVSAGNATALVPVDGRDQSAWGGVTAGARDVVIYGAQRESGGPSSLILSGTRAGDGVRRGAYTAAGRVRFGARFRPLWDRSWYSGALRVFSLDPATWAAIDAATGVLSVCVQGDLWESPGAITWSAGDTVEIWIEAGGGSQVTGASYRVNEGSATSLGQSASAQPSRVQDDTKALDLLCRDESLQLDSILESVRSTRPSWASAPSGSSASSTELPVALVFAGNSLTFGTGTTAADKKYPAVVDAALGARYTVENRGVAGWDIVNLVSDVGNITSQYSPSTKVVCAVAWECTNALGSAINADDTRTAQDLADDILGQWADYVATLRAAGIYVVTLTVLPRTDLSTTARDNLHNAARLLINASLTANQDGVYGHAIVDVAAIAQLQDSTNATYYGDLVHLTDAGYALVAATVAAALQELFG